MQLHMCTYAYIRSNVYRTRTIHKFTHMHEAIRIPQYVRANYRRLHNIISSELEYELYRSQKRKRTHRFAYETHKMENVTNGAAFSRKIAGPRQ